jgi:peptidoglycan-associated lipoprotein
MLDGTHFYAEENKGVHMRSKTGTLIFCIFCCAALVLVAGCATQEKPVSPAFPEAEGVATEVSGAERADAESMMGEGAMGDLEEGELPIPQTDLARDLLFEEASRELQTIYFDYDSSALKPQAKAKLETAADWLKRNPNVNVQIEGHCDERGTNEYNLALGERRALAARRYLVSLGINTDRIFTISYGEERAAVEGHDESAWKFNRRDEFKISF